MSSIRDFVPITVKRSRLVLDYLGVYDQKYKTSIKDIAKIRTANLRNSKLPIMLFLNLTNIIALYSKSIRTLITNRKT